jgi:hypothetical protein
MKNLLLASAILCSMFLACQPKTTGDPAADGAPSDAAVEPEKVLRHVVLFKFRDDVLPEDVRMIENAFRELPAKIDAILDFEWGINNSPEGLADGFTHCFFLTFRDEAAREVYLPHPDHAAFGELLRPHLDKVLVVDYWTSN